MFLKPYILDLPACLGCNCQHQDHYILFQFFFRESQFEPLFTTIASWGPGGVDPTYIWGTGYSGLAGKHTEVQHLDDGRVSLDSNPHFGRNPKGFDSIFGCFQK